MPSLITRSCCRRRRCLVMSLLNPCSWCVRTRRWPTATFFLRHHPFLRHLQPLQRLLSVRLLKNYQINNDSILCALSLCSPSSSPTHFAICSTLRPSLCYRRYQQYERIDKIKLISSPSRMNRPGEPYTQRRVFQSPQDYNKTAYTMLLSAAELKQLKERVVSRDDQIDLLNTLFSPVSIAFNHQGDPNSNSTGCSLLETTKTLVLGGYSFWTMLPFLQGLTLLVLWGKFCWAVLHF